MADLIYTQNYDAQNFTPAMPLLSIGLSRIGQTDPFLTLDAIIDTGADGTLIAMELLEAVEAPYVDRAYLRGITGQREPIDLYLVTIHLGQLRISGIRAGAIAPGELAILGRDVLNHMRLLLDGPAEVTEIYSETG
jgi:predicted aspartyl protease